jgi:hypothetical protein
MTDDISSLPSLVPPYSGHIFATLDPVESARDDSTSCPVVVSTEAPAVPDSAVAPEGDGVDELLGPFETPSERDVEFTFVAYASRAQLVASCKTFKVASYGRKEEIIHRLFHGIESSLNGETCILSALERPVNNPMQNRLKMSIREFADHQQIRGNPTFVPWRRAPKKQCARDSCSMGPSLSDFARLLGILTSTPAVRRAIVESGLERSRAQLDARIPRDIFWSTAVAPAFNDPSIVPSVPFYSGWTDYMGGSFEVSQASSLNREGQELKRWYQDCRAAFTFSYNKWSRSGQNDPESFHNFVPKNSTGISALGKRVLIMGAALRVGRPDEVSDLLSFTLRTVPDEISFDSLPEGSKDDESGENRTPSRKRRRDSAVSSTTSDKVEIMSEIRHAIQSMTPPKRGVVVQNAEDVSSLLKAISAAELVAKSTSIEAVKAAAEAEILRLLADLGELRK